MARADAGRLKKWLIISLVGTLAGLAGFSGAVWPLQGVALFLLELGVSVVLFEAGGRIALRWFRHNPMVLLQSLLESLLTAIIVYYVMRWLAPNWFPGEFAFASSHLILWIAGINTGLLVAVSDADGRLLWVEGHEELRVDLANVLAAHDGAEAADDLVDAQLDARVRHDHGLRCGCERGLAVAGGAQEAVGVAIPWIITYPLCITASNGGEIISLQAVSAALRQPGPAFLSTLLPLPPCP